MTQRLPTVGADSGSWGTVLNGFLNVGHNADGTNKGTTYGQFNVLDYGAVGDGVTNDTLAIQAAIDAASTAATGALVGQRATVVIPGGGKTYKLGFRDVGTPVSSPSFLSALVMRSNIELVGVDRPRLLCDNHAPAVHNIGSHHLGSPISGSTQFATNNIAVRGIVWDGGFRSNEQSAGLAFADATEDFQAINLAIVANAEFTDNVFTGIWGQGCDLGAASCVDTLYSGNYHTICNGGFMSANNANRVVITGNIFFDSQANAGGATEAMDLDSTVGSVVFSNNIMDKCGWPGVFGTPGVGAEVIFANNVVRPLAGGNGGMQIASGIAQGNIIDMTTYNAGNANGTSGISAVGPCTVSGNYIRLNPNAAANTYGILVGNGVVNVVGNTIVCSTASANITDINEAGNGSGVLIADNVCNAGSIVSCNVASNKVSIKNNKFSARIGTGNNLGTGLIVSGNTMKAESTNTALYLSYLGAIVENNYIDGSVANPAYGVIYLAGIAGSGNHIFRGNTILGSSGNPALTTVAGRLDGDTWDSNTILGGGTLSIKTTQNFKRSSGGVTALAYSATIATDAFLGDYFTIVATNGTAYTISNPTNLQPGMILTYDIKNSSGGAMGVVTWGATFKLDATGFVNPANGKRKTISFRYDGTNLIQSGPTSADI